MAIMGIVAGLVALGVVLVLAWLMSVVEPSLDAKVSAGHRDPCRCRQQVSTSRQPSTPNRCMEAVVSGRLSKTHHVAPPGNSDTWSADCCGEGRPSISPRQEGEDNERQTPLLFHCFIVSCCFSRRDGPQNQPSKLTQQLVATWQGRVWQKFPLAAFKIVVVMWQVVTQVGQS